MSRVAATAVLIGLSAVLGVGWTAAPAGAAAAPVTVTLVRWPYT